MIIFYVSMKNMLIKEIYDHLDKFGDSIVVVMKTIYMKKIYAEKLTYFKDVIMTSRN